MLAWTSGGAVERPHTLQIRLQRSYPGRVRAGAPVPTRSMPTDEVLANLRFFTAASTRGRPVDAVVWSGVGAASRPDLDELCTTARSLGVSRLTLHAGVEDLATLEVGRAPVDTIVLPLQIGESGATLAAGAAALLRCRELGLRAFANTQLTPAAIPVLPAVARVAVRAAVAGLTFTYPFPVDGAQASDVPPPARAVAALAEVVPGLRAAGLNVTIKGLPACFLGEMAGSAGRTGNRWYVDADHQLDKALLFFPDVVAFHKDDDCRFCVRDDRCDGFFATYLRRPGFGRLVPIPA